MAVVIRLKNYIFLIITTACELRCCVMPILQMHLKRSQKLTQIPSPVLLKSSRVASSLKYESIHTQDSLRNA